MFCKYIFCLPGVNVENICIRTFHFIRPMPFQNKRNASHFHHNPFGCNRQKSKLQKKISVFKPFIWLQFAVSNKMENGINIKLTKFSISCKEFSFFFLMENYAYGGIVFSMFFQFNLHQILSVCLFKL